MMSLRDGTAVRSTRGEIRSRRGSAPGVGPQSDATRQGDFLLLLQLQHGVWLLDVPGVVPESHYVQVPHLTLGDGQARHVGGGPSRESHEIIVVVAIEARRPGVKWVEHARSLRPGEGAP
jgi:hypothetical protein